MPGGCRLGDLAKCPNDSHGCKVCAHTTIGPAVQGSNDVIINGKPAVRVGDKGIHMLCCGSNTWAAADGAPSVTINGKPAARIGDQTSHCGGTGEMIAGSSNVIIGNGQGRLFQEAAKSHAPFVENVSGNRLQRTKEQLKKYLDDRGTQKYSEGHYVASYIDAVGSTMLDDMPETYVGMATNVIIDVLGGKAIKIGGKGGKLAWKKADDFIGKLKGKKILLKGVKTQRIKYTKRLPEEANALRRQFDSTERKKFLKAIGEDPKKVEQLRKAGFSEKEIAKIKEGYCPNDQWQVHHKLPLDDGGTNDMDNLVLIKNDPFHKTITNEQNALTKGLAPGETVEIDLPINDGFVYPPGK